MVQVFFILIDLCIVVLSIIESDILIIVILSISLSVSVSFAYVYLGVELLGEYIFRIVSFF